MDEHGVPEPYDWDPQAEPVRRDQVAAYDALRRRSPVAHSEAQGWSLLRHADILAAVTDPVTFSSAVSAHVAVPNGMDGAEHAAYRKVIDRCFTPERVAAFRPALAQIAAALVTQVRDSSGPVEVMTALGEPYAALSQCAYLGWGADVARALRSWSAQSQEATRRRDRAELTRVAERFDAIIVGELERARADAPEAPRTLTHELLAETLEGRSLTDDEIVAIVRNWTAGELGTIAAAVGIVVERLAADPQLRTLLHDRPDLHQAAMDELLRLQPPLISNRRRTTRPVEVSGRTIPADARVTVLWPGAQRDPEAFADPGVLRLDRDPELNLLYGRGPHYCPGEGLSRLELGVLLEALLAELPPFHLDAPPVPARYPAGGYREVRIAWDHARPSHH